MLSSLNKQLKTKAMNDKLVQLKELGCRLDDIERQEASRKEREVYLILNGLTDMVIVSDDSGTIKFANPSSHRILGYDPEDLIGEPINTILSMGVLNQLGREVNVYAEHKKGVSVPVRVYTGELHDVCSHLLITVIRQRCHHDSDPKV